MKLSSLAASLIVAVGMAWSLAYGAPGQGTQNAQFRTISESASIDEWDGNVNSTLDARAYDDLEGVRQGFVLTKILDYNLDSFSLISCSGPAYGDVVS